MAADGLPGAGFRGHPGGGPGPDPGLTAGDFGLKRAGILLLLLALAARAAGAADPQPYQVDFTPSGNGRLDATLRATSELAALRGRAPVSPAGLLARAHVDLDRLRVALESYGYYQGVVRIGIDGQDLGDAALAGHLAALAAGTTARVTVAVVPGPLYHLRRIELDATVPARALQALRLAPGQPAVAADVLAGGARLLTALQNEGYAYARVDPPVAYELPATRELDLRFHVVTGAVMRIGSIRIDGLRHMRPGRARGLLGLRSGDSYGAARVEQARRNLLDSGVFASVDVTLGAAPEPGDRVPLVFTVTERKRHAVALNAAYSSDLGGSGGVTWSDRNFLGRGAQLNLSASAININGNATNGIGFDTGAQLVIPNFLQHGQSLQLSLNAIKQSLQAYGQTAGTAAVTLDRTLSTVWGVSAGLSATQETIQQPQALPLLGRGTFHYTLFALPLSVRYDSTGLANPLDDPTHGIRAALTVAPTLSLGPPNATFIISQFRIATYQDLAALLGGQSGRTVLALRGLSGYAQGANVIDLPPDQRFYAGGSGTIRGYRFQSVGQTFADGTPVGGVSIEAMSAELRQRIGRSYGAALFLDGGRVGESAHPFAGQLRLGAGAGLRYYTPVGALRLDVALPVHRTANDDRFEVYIGLGQAF